MESQKHETLIISEKIRQDYKGLPEACFTFELWPHSFLKKNKTGYAMDKEKIKAFCLEKGLKPEHPLSEEKIRLIALQIP